jgi:hypothetical protein
MPSKNFIKTIRLQKRIYSSLRKQVDVVLGPTPNAIRSYQTDNKVDFRFHPKTTQPIVKSQLLTFIKNKDVTFIGDYHTLKQAQRTALRLIRDTIISDEESYRWYIGIEFISSQFQRELDRFQAGKMSLIQFHKCISYDESWGFPWAHYEPIFTWAKEHGVRLIALNRPKIGFREPRNQKELFQRDQWAAGIITDLFYDDINKAKKSKIIVLFGELHIGSLHLPLQLQKVSRALLKKPLSYLSIFQNEDDLYWKVTEKYRNKNVDAIKLSSEVFCIFSNTPWTKLQSVLTWAEGGLSDPLNEQDVDYLFLFRNYGNFICEFLGILPPPFDCLHVETIGTIDLAKVLKGKQGHFTREEQKLIRQHIHNNVRLFIPSLNIAYLGTASSNRVAELVGLYIFRSNTRLKQLIRFSSDDFYRLILEATFGFFCSLLLNPKRRCDYFKDHLKHLRWLRKTRKESFPGELLARKITIQFFRTYQNNLLSISSDFFRGHPFSLVMAGKFIGQILGKALHQGVVNGIISIDTIQMLFLFRSKQTDTFFSEKLEDLICILSESIKLPREKSEHL